MFNSIAFITGDILTDVLICNIFLIFVFFCIREMIHIQHAMLLLKRIIGIKEKHQDNIVNLEIMSDEQQLWINEHLIFTNKEGLLYIENKEDRWLSKSSLYNMLPYYDSSRYKLVPGLLICIGVIGTFMGIIFTLTKLNFGNEMYVAISSATAFVEGMRTSFYTSLVGLISAVMFIVLLKLGANAVANTQRDFLHRLSQQYFEVSPVHYLKNNNQINQQDENMLDLHSAKAIENMAEKMEETFSSFTQLKQSLADDAIADKVSTALANSMESQVAPVLYTIKNELENLKDIKSQSEKNIIGLMVDEMKTNLIAPVASALEETHSVLIASNQLTEKLTNSVDKILHDSQTNIESIAFVQQEALFKLHVFSEGVQELLENAKSNNQHDVIADLCQEFKRLLDITNQNMQQNTSDLDAKFYRHSEIFFTDLTSKIEHILNKMTENLNAQNQLITHNGIEASNLMLQVRADFEASFEQKWQQESELLQAQEIRLNKVMQSAQQIFAEQADVMRLTGESAAGVMLCARDELEKGLGDMNGKILTMSNIINHELAAFRSEYQEQLCDYFDQQSHFLDASLDKQKAGLNEVVDNFRAMFERDYQARDAMLRNLLTHYEQLEQSAHTVERVAKAIGLNDMAKMTEMQYMAETLTKEVALFQKEHLNATRSIIQEMDKLKKEYAKATTALITVAEYVPNKLKQ